MMVSVRYIFYSSFCPQHAVHCDLHKVQHKWCGTNISDKERKNFIHYLTSMVNITKCECVDVGWGISVLSVVEFQAMQGVIQQLHDQNFAKPCTSL